MKLEENYKNWHLEHANTWKILPSPARPSKGEISIIKKYLEVNEKEINVLILGSTPEFRDLCNQPNIKSTCIDINEQIYKALTILQKRPNKNEKFINDNWLTFKENQLYECILGDAVTAMFDLSSYKQFFQNMHRHLKKKGLLIIRVPYQDERFKIPIKKVIKNFREKCKSKKPHIYTETFNFLVMNYRNKARSSISLLELAKKIEIIFERKILSEKEYSDLIKYYKNLTLELFYPTEKYIREVSNEYFTVVAKEFSMDYSTSLCNPIFVFERR